jgi:hypothetical protein
MRQIDQAFLCKVPHGLARNSRPWLAFRLPMSPRSRAKVAGICVARAVPGEEAVRRAYRSPEGRSLSHPLVDVISNKKTLDLELLETARILAK